MLALKDKVQNALDEARMLILGAQVLVGFQFGAVLSSGFEHLSSLAQYLNIVSLFIMLFAVALLVAPGTYHQIVNNGQDTRSLVKFTTQVMTIALLPFALSLGIDMYITIEKIAGPAAQFIAGISTFLVAVFLWYGWEMIRKYSHHSREKIAHNQSKEPLPEFENRTELKDRIKQVLTEVRVVLPGTQALLGFQFAAIVQSGFDQLPVSSKYIHVASLALVALSITLLMTPAAYHRIVDQGDDTEHFHRLATRLLIAAMIPFGLGVCGDFFVVARKVTNSIPLAGTASVLILAFFYLLWFGYTMYRRRHRSIDAVRFQHRSRDSHLTT